jgi:ankyrin repeat protein
MLAAKNGHHEVVKFLISAGANVKLRDKNDDTAMMIATENDQEDIAILLKRAGAIPEKKPEKEKPAPIEAEDIDDDDDDLIDDSDVDDLVSDEDAPDEIELDD